MGRAPAVYREISQIRPMGRQDPAIRAYLASARRGLEQALTGASEAVADILDVYDQAFAELVHKGDPQAFREFLLGAPGRFIELGNRLGAINHLVSFWAFRFPPERRAYVTPEELADIFLDFETGLIFNKAQAVAA